VEQSPLSAAPLNQLEPPRRKQSVRVEKVKAGDADGLNALLFQVGVSASVARLVVLLAIDFHAQRAFRAIEVQMVRAYRNLGLEKEAKLPLSQSSPENLLADGALPP
jgi:hypothetical protein